MVFDTKVCTSLRGRRTKGRMSTGPSPLSIFIESQPLFHLSPQGRHILLQKSNSHHGYCWKKDGSLVCLKMESESYEELCQRRAELEQFLQRDFDSNMANNNSNIPPNHWDHVMKEAVRSLYSSANFPCSHWFLFISHSCGCQRTSPKSA